jgi:hypothetical protein
MALLHSASNRNKYQEYLRGRCGECIGLTTLALSGSLNILEPSGAVRARIVLDTFMHQGWMEMFTSKASWETKG